MVHIQCLSGVARQVFGRDLSILEESAGRSLIQCNNDINNNILFTKVYRPQVTRVNLSGPVILSIGDNFILLCARLFKYQRLFKGEREFTVYKGFTVYKVIEKRWSYQFMLYLRNGQSIYQRTNLQGNNQ